MPPVPPLHLTRTDIGLSQFMATSSSLRPGPTLLSTSQRFYGQALAAVLLPERRPVGETIG